MNVRIEVVCVSADGSEQRKHMQATAERIEQELGEERQLNVFDGSEDEWEQQPLPDGPITVGIDGGYFRAAHKQGYFEVIAGRVSLLSGARMQLKCPRQSALASCKPTTKSLADGCGSY